MEGVVFIIYGIYLDALVFGKVKHLENTERLIILHKRSANFKENGSSKYF